MSAADSNAKLSPLPAPLNSSTDTASQAMVFGHLVEHMLNGIAYCRMVYENDLPTDFIFLYTNRAFHKQTGLGDVTGRRASDVFSGITESDRALIETYGRVARGGQPETFEIFVEAVALWFSISVYSPQPDHFVAVFDVITERKRAQTVAEQYRAVIHASLDGFWITDTTGRILDTNPAMCRISGYSREELLHLNIRDFEADETPEEIAAHTREMQENGHVQFEARHRRKDGVIINVEVSVLFVPELEERFFAFVRDITERKRLESELTRRAHLDYLTGVSSRGHFMEQVELELSRAQRYAKDLSILMMDLDFFKQVNDSHGHKAGDTVLKKLAEVCRHALRDVDIIGRVGGEEFAILLPETEKQEAVEVAERLRAAIGSARVPMEQGLPLRFTVSIGVASMATRDDNVDVLLSLADKALYEAKNSGRNRVCVATS